MTIHIALLATFVLVTSGLMVAAVLDRMRVRPVRLMWYSRAILSGYGWSVVFLALIVGVIIYAGVVRDDLYLYLGIGYLIGAICWCAALRLSSATVVTDFALIRNAGRSANVLTWSQVVDFFVRREGNKLLYVFFYLDADGRRSRFEIQVPQAYHSIFNRMVYQYVEKNKMSVPERAYG